jgi:hypothetical protein
MNSRGISMISCIWLDDMIAVCVCGCRRFESRWEERKVVCMSLVELIECDKESRSGRVQLAIAFAERVALGLGSVRKGDACLLAGWLLPFYGAGIFWLLLSREILSIPV